MTDFQKYIQRYLDLIPGVNWLEELRNSGTQTLEMYESFSEEQSDYAYAEGKWSLKIVLQHLIDAERIFVYRALRFSRNDRTELPGWDEEEYAKHYFPKEKSLKNLIEEFEHLRKSTVLFFENINPKTLSQKGIANHNEISVETIGKLIVGHNIHHLNIIKERYLPNLT
ncbi:DinB family protein [Chryseobacterium gotjawalense]|uniref:DinB family protein n=1 Tax=Chryseobacterium gotjawalense TaxID=3042315 RepID=A0ABY8RG60_9FLAO|nr:DinB family protein [Chryseobacterium sp. wdc7]WHF52961.1 DinB family protein [Chryseobacterium sp. wdc7]